MNIGVISYLVSALAFGFFAVLLVASRQGQPQGKWLLAVIVVQVLWAVFAAMFALGYGWAGGYHLFESLRYLAWFAFFAKLLQTAGEEAGESRFLRRAVSISVIFVISVVVIELAIPLLTGYSFAAETVLFRNISHILLAISGLAIIEQLYRNTAPRYQWAIKYLYLGAGGIFAFDLYLYSQAVLFHAIDRSSWEVRGFVTALMVPLLIVATARNREWSRNIFVSRHVVLGTTTLLGAGIYLMLVAVSGFYLRESGGEWGRVFQIVFFSLALILLATIMMSRQLRARAQVFLGKHFYRNKYDYRNEWLRLTRELEENRSTDNNYQAVIQAMANIVAARGGLLWLHEREPGYRNIAVLNVASVRETVPVDSGLITFLDETGYIINLEELDSHSDEYPGLVIPGWFAELDQPWLIVPLTGSDALIGFVVLTRPLVKRSINWEDRDLLKTAANQAASYLTVLQTSEALTRARQFEVFNRLSAYMVHDLKNISAELQLVSRNAERHGDNPEFIKDAFDTVNNAATDIDRLLEQLRNKAARPGKKMVLELCDLIREVIQISKDNHPVPVLESPCPASLVFAERSRLRNVIQHLVENAQQATADSGDVIVRLRHQPPDIVMTIADTGSGMDEAFIQKRLFNPFDTTKGNAGMGIGMYESRECIQQLGGSINVSSQPGEGTVIEIRLPVADEGEKQ